MSFFFIQMADPQFGLFASFSGLDRSEVDALKKRGLNVRISPTITGFSKETTLYEKAISESNRLKPAFVVMCGDMVNDADNPSQLAELRRITDGLDDSIRMYWAAGNHDIGNVLTSKTLQNYRERFGEDNYFFNHEDSRFIVLNSNVAYDPTYVPEEWESLTDFLSDSLRSAQQDSIKNTTIFMHHPLFLRDPREPDSIFAIPEIRRKILLDLMTSYNVTAVFAGHYHRNCYAQIHGLQMVTTGAIGYPLGNDPSGFRIVKVYSDRIEHRYHGLYDVPRYVKV